MNYIKECPKITNLQQRLFKMVSVGIVDEPLNQAYDIISTSALLINLVGAFASTFDSIHASYGTILAWVESITVLFFAIDYFLRLFTANCLYPDKSMGKSLLAYMISFTGIIDLLSFMPYYLPFVFPSGVAVFRLFRVARILRLFRINAYYDSLNVITEVIVSKKQQLLSSVFIILILMMASSLCMYSLEHEAQPTVFENAFSGIWWSVSTLLTVGYGDIYPITPMGKLFGILISFLGVGMVAIPTGIISAGFVEQYTRLKRMGDYAREEDMHFINATLLTGDKWIGSRVKELNLPQNMILAAIQRHGEIIVPRGDVILEPSDTIILGAEALSGRQHIELREITIGQKHEWNGTAIRDLDISRQTFIVSIKRKGRMIVPNGDLVLHSGDTIFLYSKVSIHSDNNY